MMNLKVTCEHGGELKNYKTNNPSLKLSECDSLFCVVTDNDRMCLRIEEKVYCFTTKGDLESVSILDSANMLHSKLVAVEFNRATRKIYLAYSCGWIYTLVTFVKEPKPRFIKQIAKSIKIMKFSPDSKILTLVTSNDAFTLLTNDLHVIREVKLSLCQSKKPVAKAKPGFTEESESEDEVLQVSWKADSSLLAINYFSKGSRTLQFQVFDNTGALQYASNLLEGNLAWGPSSNEIAATYSFPNKYVVSYFEESGSKRSDLMLAYEPEEILVKELNWSTDVDVLAIWCINTTDGISRIQLWSEDNAHWYLKQTLSFPEKNPVLYISWAPDLKLYVLTEKLLLMYKFIWTNSHSYGMNETDKAVVGVIDGDRALLTAFRHSILQPPMAHQALCIHESINEIVFAPDIGNKKSWINSNVLFTVLHNNQLAFFKQESELVEYVYIKSYEIEWEKPKPAILETIPYSMYNFLWYKEDTILCAMAAGQDNLLCVISMDGIGPQKNGRLIVRNTHAIKDSIQHIVHSPDPETVYIMTNGILTYSKNSIQNTKICVNSVCQQMKVIEVENKHIILWLSAKSFYFDGKPLARNITSFFIHSRFLLLTTVQDTLISISLDTADFVKKLTHNLFFKPPGGVDDEKFFSGLSITGVEKGCKLLTAVPRDMRIILQVEDGKLKCVQPGAHLQAIHSYLTELNYRAAFDLIKKQGVNWNLMFDHDPDLFIANTPKFIRDMKDPGSLNLFLSNLKEEDVTTTIYARCYSNTITDDDNGSSQMPSPVNDSKIPSVKYAEKLPKSKIKFVCDLLRKNLEARTDANRFLLPIMTSIVKKHEIQDLEEALLKIKSLKTLESQNKTQQHGSSERALEYLLHFVNADRLFDVALGMYDFEMVQFIAIKSKKNTEEYVPFLNHLKKLDENYMQYYVNMVLKRYEVGLDYISKCNDRFKECITLIEDHNLYSKALTLYKVNSEQYKEIAERYGDHLMKAGKYQEAAIMFTRSNYNLAKTFNAFKLAGDLREAITVAKQMKFELTDLHSLYEVLAMQLKGDKKYGDAAIIFIDNLNRPEDAVAALCEGKLWQDALRVAHEANNPDVIETKIKPGVQKQVEYMISKIAKNQADLMKYKERLSSVESTKLSKVRARQGSQSSRSPGDGNTTNVKRRKVEEKFTDEYSVLKCAMDEIVAATYADRIEVNCLVTTLLRLYNDADAEKLRSLQEGLLYQIGNLKQETSTSQPNGSNP